MRTWQKEAFVVGAVLFSVVVLTGGKPIEYIGALAVYFTFMHAQIGFRFSEAAQNQENVAALVPCHAKSTRYFIAKEALWFLYFSLLGAWSALVGVFVFILYPFWRRWYRLNRGCKSVTSL